MLLKPPVLDPVLGKPDRAWLSRIDAQEIANASLDELLLLGNEQFMLLLCVSRNIAL